MRFANLQSGVIKLAILWAIIINSVFGDLRWENLQFQQTASPDNKKTVAVFRFKNEGNSPVVITSVTPSCGCTTAELGKQSYLPGESGEIKATFTFDGRTGFQQKTITVTTDYAASKLVTLLLRVTIEDPVTCSSHLLLWNTREKTLEKDVTISPAGSNKIVSLEANSVSPADFAVQTEPAGDGAYRLRVRPASTLKVMNIAINCIVRIENGEPHRFQIYALVR